MGPVCLPAKWVILATNHSNDMHAYQVRKEGRKDFIHGMVQVLNTGAWRISTCGKYIQSPRPPPFKPTSSQLIHTAAVDRPSSMMANRQGEHTATLHSPSTRQAIPIPTLLLRSLRAMFCTRFRNRCSSVLCWDP